MAARVLTQVLGGLSWPQLIVLGIGILALAGFVAYVINSAQRTRHLAQLIRAARKSASPPDSRRRWNG